MYVLIDSTNTVTNIISYDGISPYTPDNGHTLLQAPAGTAIGATYANGVFTNPYVAPPVLSASDKAALAIEAGATITSTSTQSLNGTYACDALTTNEINAVVTYILVNNAFPAGQVTLPWPDISGAMHSFTVTEFKAFASAIANYVASLTLFKNGVLTTLPSNQITIG